MTTANQAAVCIPNIGREQRRRRLFGGIAGIAITTILGIYLKYIDASIYWQLTLFLPLFGALSGFFQAHHQT